MTQFRRKHARDAEASRRRIENLLRKAKRHPDARVVLHDALLEASDVPYPGNPEYSIAEVYAQRIRRAEEEARERHRKLYVYVTLEGPGQNYFAVFALLKRGSPYKGDVLVYTTRAGYTRKPTRLELLKNELPEGWSVHSYHPGDGVTRYGFFYNAPRHQKYSGPAAANYTALGLKAARRFAASLEQDEK